MRKKIVQYLALCGLLALTAAAAFPVPVRADEAESTSLESEEISTEALGDPDELFAGYAGSRFYGARRRRIANGAGKLTGIGLEVYTAMREKISDVAAGEAETSRFQVPVSGFLEKTFYTAQELGLEEAALTDADGKLSQAAREAVYKKTGWDHKAVLMALLADSPYEFYWYDKTGDFLYGDFALELWQEENGRLIVLIPEDASVVYYLPVAEDYAQDPASYDYEDEKSGIRMHLSLKTEKTRAASEAVKTARQIVDDAAQYSDLDKLTYYASEVCRLASYDSGASAAGYTYGDSWQIINVFDNNPETKVVCEGYAKAFQYLCDLTNFNTEIKCLSVTGTMKGGTGAGRHMWNVVQLPDGENYLADLTNCDEGTLGAPDRLFLAGCERIDRDYTFRYLTDTGGISYHYDSDMAALYGPEDLFLAEHAAHLEHLCTDSPVIVSDQASGALSVEYTCGLCGESVREACGADAGTH